MNNVSTMNNLCTLSENYLRIIDGGGIFEAIDNFIVTGAAVKLGAVVVKAAAVAGASTAGGALAAVAIVGCVAVGGYSLATP